MRAYITYDLDILTASVNRQKHLNYLHQLLSLPCDKLAVVAHHRIIPHIKSCKPDIIYNVDYHSDICIGQDLPKRYLNCGTWSNYVEAERFEWVHPHRNRYEMDLGYCHLRDGHNPFKINKTPFGKVSHSNTLPPLKDVVGVSISLSYPYGGCPDLFADLVEQYRLPVIEKRGDWNTR